MGYSVYRDNWWCGGMGEEKNWTDSYSTGYNYRGGRDITSSPQRLPNELPSFVTPAMASEAQQEQAAIHKIGDAPAYFGMRTLAWVKAHSSDPRAAELLGFAFRAMRNGCNLERTRDCGMKCSMCSIRDIAVGWARRYADFDSEPQ